jgi:hypothetical protein
MVIQVTRGEVEQQAEGKLAGQEFANRIKTLIY